MSTFAHPIEERPLKELLTPREFEVARLAAEGMSFQSIALEMGITAGSAKQRASLIYAKLDCENRVELALRFARENTTMTTLLNRLPSLAGLCKNCRVLLETPKHAKFEVESQLWTCQNCGKARKWGFRRPWDRWFVPALNCESCDAVTRHVFLRVEGC